MYFGWALVHLGAGPSAGCGWIIAVLPATAECMNLDIRRQQRRLASALGRPCICPTPHRSGAPCIDEQHRITGRIPVIVANPAREDSYAEVRTEQDARGGQASLL
jgi:hypothetical protein